MKRAILCLGLLSAACSPAGDGPTTAPTEPEPIAPTASPMPVPTPSPSPAPMPAPQGFAQLRVVHAAPDAPAVDVYASGSSKALVSGLAYGAASAYVIVPAGDYRIEVRAAGADPASAPVFVTDPVSLVDQARVTAFAAGLLASQDAADRFRILPLVEDFEPAAVGSARVRVVHLSADAPAVDVDVGDDGSVELPDLARFADSGAHGVNLPAGQKLQIALRAGGARVTAFTTGQLNDGAELFVVAAGLLKKTPRELQGLALVAVDAHGAVRVARQNPVVYALHASPDAPTVDLFVGSKKIVDAISFSGLSHPVQVPPGSYTIDFFAHTAGGARPAGAPAASATTPPLAAGERYLASATGFLSPLAGEAPFQLQAYSDGFVSGTTAIRAIHQSPDAPKVDVGIAADDKIATVLFPGLSFSESSAGAGLEVGAGTYRIGVAAAGALQTAATFTLALGQGVRSFVLAAGALSPAAGEQGFRLLLVDTASWPWTATSVAAH